MICEGKYLVNHRSINQDNGGGNSFIQNINQGEMCEGEGSCYIV